MRFDDVFAYENRNHLHTSRWVLNGVSTADDGPTDRGWMYLKTQRSGTTVSASLYSDPSCETDQCIAAGSCIAPDDETPVQCALTSQNESGVSGSFLLIAHREDPVSPIPLLVSLVTDADLTDLYADAAHLPVQSELYGLARYCALATRRSLMLAAQLYADQLGRCDADATLSPDRTPQHVPDFRRIADPRQMRPAAAHAALAAALHASQQIAEESVYSQLYKQHEVLRRRAIGAWNLTLNTNPDADNTPDTQKHAGMIRLHRT